MSGRVTKVGLTDPGPYCCAQSVGSSRYDGLSPANALTATLHLVSGGD